jgi:hypothetical protein
MNPFCIDFVRLLRTSLGYLGVRQVIIAGTSAVLGTAASLEIRSAADRQVLNDGSELEHSQLLHRLPQTRTDELPMHIIEGRWRRWFISGLFQSRIRELPVFWAAGGDYECGDK